MTYECQCGFDCPLCENCGSPECECKCDLDYSSDEDEDGDKKDEWEDI